MKTETIKIKSLINTRGKTTGWSIEFELPAEDEALLDTFPDGCLVVYWEEEE